jgi:gamma-glutamylcysteine synthetase
MPIFARLFALLLALFVLPEASAQRLHRMPNIEQQSIAAERDIRDRTNSGAVGLGFDPKWKNVELSARSPGLQFVPVQDWLDRSTAKQSSHP